LKKKVVIVSVIFGTIILGLIAAIATVIVSRLSSMGASFKVGYTVKDVYANVAARYWTGEGGWKLLGSEAGLTFNNTSETMSGELNPSEENIRIENENTRIVFEYSFVNNSDSIYLNLDLIEMPVATSMSVGYYVSPVRLNNVSTINPPYEIEAWTSRTLELNTSATNVSNSTTYVYIIVEVEAGAKNASYVGNFEWLLQVPNECAIVYDMEGVSNYSEFTGNYIALQGMPYATINTVPKYYSSGYVFAGWYTDEARTNLFVDQTIVDENMTLYPLFYAGNVSITEENYDEDLGGYVVDDLTTISTNSVSIRGGVDSVKAAPENSVVIPDDVTINGETKPVVAVTGVLDRNIGISGLYIGNNVKTIPSWINGYNHDLVMVDGLRDTILTTIYLGKSLTAIPDYAFAASIAISSPIVIPYSCRSIGSSAFNACVSVTNVVLPESVVEIGSYAFASNSISSINLPGEITTINERTFNRCSKLLNIVISDKVTSIDIFAFNLCTSLIDVKFSDSLESIGDYAFYQCSSLFNVKFLDKLENIGQYAFYDCQNLSSIDFSNNLKTIGSYAFYGCKLLEAVYIPAATESIGGRAFGDCDALQSIIVDNNNPIYDSRGNCNAIIETSINVMLVGCASTKFPESVIAIAPDAFRDNSSITEVVIPGNIKGVGDNAFRDCTRLKDVEFEEGVEYIYAYAFNGCVNVTNIQFPTTLKCISPYSFINCDKMTELTINGDNCLVESQAFNNCSALTKVNLVGVRELEDNVFINCTKLTEVNMSDTLETIGSFAFRGCKIVNLYIPKSVTFINSAAFAGGSPNLATIVVDEENKYYTDGGVNAIIRGKTLYTGSVNTTTIPDYITSLGPSSFWGRNIISIDLNQVEDIGQYAFSSCPKLTQINIPSSVVKISKQAFNSDCTKLTNIIFEDSSGWWTASSSSATEGSAIDVSDSEQNAINLKTASVWQGLYLHKS